MLQIHFDVDPADKRHVGMLLAAFNAIADFLMHASPSLGENGPGIGMPMQGPATTAQPGAPAAKQRKPKGGAAAQPPQAEQPGLPFQQQQPMQGPSASFGQPVPGNGALGDIQAPPPPDIKITLHNSLRDFATNYGPMALQGLLAYFGVSKTSELQLARADEILQYIRAAQAQASQAGQLG